MQYAILCNHDAKVTCAWSRAADRHRRPFAETKEQLLGFYVLDCKDLEEALGFARELASVNPGGGYEIRPVGMFFPGQKAP